MRPLRYSINVTLDGCCDHRVGVPDEESHRYWAASLERADALIFGRVTYQMMAEAWRRPASGVWPDWMDDGHIAFAQRIGAAKKFVVSSTLEQVDWNTEILQGDLRAAVQQLKEEPGERLFVGGVTLPLALANLGLIDEYEFVVLPVLAGHGPRLLDGLNERVELELVGRQEFRSGSVALRYQPRRATTRRSVGCDRRADRFQDGHEVVRDGGGTRSSAGDEQLSRGAHGDTIDGDGSSGRSGSGAGNTRSLARSLEGYLAVSGLWGFRETLGPGRVRLTRVGFSRPIWNGSGCLDPHDGP